MRLPGRQHDRGDDCAGHDLAGSRAARETDHIDFPFPFTFYDTTYTFVHAGVSGNLQFPNASGTNSGCLPDPELGPAILAYFEPLSAELHASDGEGIYTSVSGTAPNRIVNIEWRAHAIGGPPNSVHFEVRFYEGAQSKFEIIYDQVDAGGSHAVVGVQRNGTDTHYQAWGNTCQSDPLSHGMKITYTGVVPERHQLECGAELDRRRPGRARPLF